MGLTYEVHLPIVSGTDVVKRVLKIKAGNNTVEKTLEFSDTVNRLAPVNEGDSVEITLLNVDSAGEQTTVDTISFTANGNYPEQGGKIGVSLLNRTAAVVEVSVPETPAPEPPPVAPKAPAAPEPPVVEDTLPSASG